MWEIKATVKETQGGSWKQSSSFSCKESCGGGHFWATKRTCFFNVFELTKEKWLFVDSFMCFYGERSLSEADNCWYPAFAQRRRFLLDSKLAGGRPTMEQSKLVNGDQWWSNTDTQGCILPSRVLQNSDTISFRCIKAELAQRWLYSPQAVACTTSVEGSCNQWWTHW